MVPEIGEIGSRRRNKPSIKCTGPAIPRWQDSIRPKNRHDEDQIGKGRLKGSTMHESGLQGKLNSKKKPQAPSSATSWAIGPTQ